MTSALKLQWRKENNKGTFRIPSPALPKGEGVETGSVLVLSFWKTK